MAKLKYRKTRQWDRQTPTSPCSFDSFEEKKSVFIRSDIVLFAKGALLNVLVLTLLVSLFSIGLSKQLGKSLKTDNNDHNNSNHKNQFHV